jgi:hypothetical protein
LQKKAAILTYAAHVRAAAGLAKEQASSNRGIGVRGYRLHCRGEEKEMRVVAATQRLARNTVVLRISVGLIAKAARDLRRTQERSGLSVADIVNRALTLYEFVDGCLAAGDQVLVRRKGARRLEQVRLT